MSTKKTHNLDTLDVKAKKKKTFIIVIILVAIVGILGVSIGSALLSVDKKKIYEERKKIDNAKELKIIQNPEFKENWAISMENRMEDQEKTLVDVMNELTGKQDRSLDELKQIIRESSENNKEDLESMTETFEARIASLRNEVAEQMQSQTDKMNQLELMSKEYKATAPNSGDIIIGGDLLPKFRNNNTPKTKIIEKIIIKEVKVGEKKDDKEKLDTNSLDIEESDGFDLNIENEEDPLMEADLNTTEDSLELDNNVSVQNTDQKNTLDLNSKEDIITKETEDTLEEVVEPEVPIDHKKKIRLVSIDTSFNTMIINNQLSIDREYAIKNAPEKQKNSYHISTGLTQAYMITGAYAPAFQEGESEPLPVLFEAEGDILVANDHLQSVEKCFLLGSAKGNMNSQTANIKLVSISCILGDGDFRIEGAISGWVIGENGIPGIHGELLHKNGAWLARTFVSGFLETFSTALSGSQAQSIQFDDQADGSISTSIGTNAVTAGAQGVSTVFNKLGEYYLKMAEQIFPIIEVKGGRTIDILLIGGEDLSVTENDSMEIGKVNNDIDTYLMNKDSESQARSANNAFTRSISNGGGSNSDEMPPLPGN